MKSKSEPAAPGSKRSIGQLAAAAGVNVETVRYYHRRGLIPLPPKRLGGQRHYPDSALRTIAMIRRAQALGFTLDEIASILKIGDGRSCEGGRGFAQRKYEELGERVAVLNAMRRQLAALVKKCDANEGGEPCPFIRELEGD